MNNSHTPPPTSPFSDDIQSTQQGQVLPSEVVQRFATLFSGRTDAWGTVEGKCIWQNVTLEHYRHHLTGKVSLGIYPLLDDGTSWWAAADLDQWGNAPWHNGPDDATPSLTLMESLNYYGVNQGIFMEKTKRKGWRVWLFLSQPLFAKDARRIFYAALTRAALPSSIEVFPKQDSIRGIKVGNYVHLPYFGGGPSGPRLGRVFIDPATLVPIPFGDLLGNLRVFPADALPLVLENLPAAETKQKTGHTPGEIIAMLSQPLAVGERRPTLIKLTGYLRCRGIAVEVAVALLRPWAQKMFTEPLTAEEIERHVRGIYHRYGMQERKLGKKSWHAEVTL